MLQNHNCLSFSIMKNHSQQVYIRVFYGLKCEEAMLYSLGYIGRQLSQFASSGIDRSILVLDNAAKDRKCLVGVIDVAPTLPPTLEVLATTMQKARK